ncbi:MAG: serine/threonine-protein kinase [Myxococcota bacterium]
MTIAQQRVIGRYVLGGAIGAGGMATVHFGRLLGPAGFSRTVAIKQLRPGLPTDSEALTTFLDEARLASRIHHPNVVAPIDVVLLDKEAFIVMEYVHGESLSRLIKAAVGSPVPPAIAASIMTQVLLGLHAAHRAVSEEGTPLELVHRDVSPQNILITQHGVARLLDFGIAKATSQMHRTVPGVLKGKLAYMAPEQLTSSPIDCRTDLFAAGTVLWEMLTAQRLFLADTPAECAKRITQGEVPPPSQLAPNVPPELDDVVLMALARDPAARFSDAQAMAFALGTAVRGASALEVAAWVRELASDALNRRAQEIADFEAAPLEEFTQDLPAPAKAPAAFASATRSPATPTTSGGADLVLPVEDYVSVISPRPRRSLRRRAVIGAMAVLTLGTVTLATKHVAQRYLVGRDEPKVMITHAASPEKPAPVLPSISPAVSPSIAVADARLSPNPSVTEAPSRDDSPLPSAAPVSPRPRAPIQKTSRSSQRSSGSLSASASPASTISPPARPVLTATRSSACDVPYTIDERGVKRFNPDCF